MVSSNTSQIKALLIVLTIFVIGFAAGALSMNLYTRANMPAAKERSEYSKPEDHIVEKMSKELELTPKQRDSVREILGQTFDQYRELKKEMEPRIKDFEPRFNAVRQEGRQKIRALLTEEQLPKFEEMIQKQDSMREKRNR